MLVATQEEQACSFHSMHHCSLSHLVHCENMYMYHHIPPHAQYDVITHTHHTPTCVYTHYHHHHHTLIIAMHTPVIYAHQ